MITRAARFSINEDAVLWNKIKTCDEKALVLKLEKGNNLTIFWTTVFEGVKEIIDNLVPRAIPLIAKRCAGDKFEIIENTVKQSKVEYLRNVDQKRRISSESIRVKKRVKERSSNIYS